MIKLVLLLLLYQGLLLNKVGAFEHTQSNTMTLSQIIWMIT